MNNIPKELIEALKNNQDAEVLTLVRTIDNVFELKDNKGNNVLYLAVQYGHLETVKYLVEHGAEIEARYKATPLHVAAQQGHIEVVKYLVEQGGDIKSTDHSEGYAPLHLAVRYGHLEVVEYLVKQGANIEATIRPIARYSRNGDHTATEYFISSLWTSLHLAVQYGHLEVVKYLVKQGAKVEAEDQEGATPLHFAVEEYGHLEVVECLVKQGANIEAKNQEGETPLNIAARWGKTEIVKYLVKQGANIEAGDQEGQTPLDVAVLEEQIEVVKYLVEQGAKIEAGDHNRYSPLHHAAYWGCREIIKYLVGQGADINVEYFGATPLHIAARRLGTETVKCLVEQGANIEAMDQRGHTPIFACLISNQYTEGRDRQFKTLAELIIQGADLNFSNYNFNHHFTGKVNKIVDICNNQQKIVVLANIIYALNYSLIRDHDLLLDIRKYQELSNQLGPLINKVKQDITKDTWNVKQQIEICEELNKLKTKIKIAPPFEDLRSFITPQDSLNDLWKNIDEYLPQHKKLHNYIFKKIFDDIRSKINKHNIAEMGERIASYLDDENREKLIHLVLGKDIKDIKEAKEKMRREEIATKEQNQKKQANSISAMLEVQSQESLPDDLEEVENQVNKKVKLTSVDQELSSGIHEAEVVEMGLTATNDDGLVAHNG